MDPEMLRREAARQRMLAMFFSDAQTAVSRKAIARDLDDLASRLEGQARQTHPRRSITGSSHHCRDSIFEQAAGDLFQIADARERLLTR